MLQDMFLFVWFDSFFGELEKQFFCVKNLVFYLLISDYNKSWQTIGQIILKLVSQSDI